MITHRIMETTDIERVLDMELREIDQVEVVSATGLPVREAVEFSVRSSNMVYVIENEDRKIVGFWGFAGVGKENFCIPWFLCSNDLFKNKRDRITFARESRMVIDGLSKMSPFLFNFVHVANEEAQDWLKWLGFTIHEDTIHHLHSYEPFYMFTKGINACVNSIPH